MCVGLTPFTIPLLQELAVDKNTILCTWPDAHMLLSNSVAALGSSVDEDHERYPWNSPFLRIWIHNCAFRITAPRSLPMNVERKIRKI